MTYTTSISSKGQITVPAALRRQLNIEVGDSLQVAVKSGKLVIEPDGYEAELQELRTIARQHLAKKGLVNLPIPEITKRASEARTNELKKKYGVRA